MTGEIPTSVPEGEGVFDAWRFRLVEGIMSTFLKTSPKTLQRLHISLTLDHQFVPNGFRRSLGAKRTVDGKTEKLFLTLENGSVTTVYQASENGVETVNEFDTDKSDSVAAAWDISLMSADIRETPDDELSQNFDQATSDSLAGKIRYYEIAG